MTQNNLVSWCAFPYSQPLPKFFFFQWLILFCLYSIMGVTKHCIHILWMWGLSVFWFLLSVTLPCTIVSYRSCRSLNHWFGGILFLIWASCLLVMTERVGDSNRWTGSFKPKMSKENKIMVRTRVGTVKCQRQKKRRPRWGGIAWCMACHIWRKSLLCLRGAWLITSGRLHWAAQLHTSTMPHSSCLSRIRSTPHRGLMSCQEHPSAKLKLFLCELFDSSSQCASRKQAYLDLHLSGLDTSVPFPKSSQTTSACNGLAHSSSFIS